MEALLELLRLVPMDVWAPAVGQRQTVPEGCLMELVGMLALEQVVLAGNRITQGRGGPEVMALVWSSLWRLQASAPSAGIP